VTKEDAGFTPCWWDLGLVSHGFILVGPVLARKRCRISPSRFLAECRKGRLNQGSFVLLCFALFAFSGLCIACLLSVFLICLLSCIFQREQREWRVPLRIYSLRLQYWHHKCFPRKSQCQDFGKVDVISGHVGLWEIEGIVYAVWYLIDVSVQQLVDAVQRFGTSNWVKVAEYMPGRTSGQCRERCVTFAATDS